MKNNIKDFKVYRDNMYFKTYRVTAESIVDIIKILGKKYGQNFMAVHSENRTRIIYICK